MRLNPFSPGIDGGLISFQDKSKHLLIKMVELQSGGHLENILQNCAVPSNQVNETQECIQVRYSSGIKRIFYSISILYDDSVTNRQDIENELTALFDKQKGNETKDIIDFQVVYASPLNGDTDLLLKLVKNSVISVNPVNKEIHGTFAIFSIIIFNLEMYPEFFSFIEDVAVKMNVRLDIYFFIKRHVQKPRITLYLLIHGKNIRSLDEILKNLQKTDEFKAVSSKVKASKSLLASLFIRWHVHDQFASTLDNITEFIKKHPCFAMDVLTPPLNAGVVPSANGFQGLDTPLCLCTTLPDKIAIQRFHDAIAKLGEKGTFLDDLSWIADHGRRIFLVHMIDASALKNLLQNNSVEVVFELVFTDPIELDEFSRILPSRVDGLYSTSTLDDFSSDGEPSPQSTEVC
jgi:hypothetical protein